MAKKTMPTLEGVTKKKRKVTFFGMFFLVSNLEIRCDFFVVVFLDEPVRKEDAMVEEEEEEEAGPSTSGTSGRDKEHLEMSGLEMGEDTDPGTVEKSFRRILRDAIESRVIYRTKNSYKCLVETTSGDPSASFIARETVKALEDAGLEPCNVNICPGYLLRKYKKRRNAYLYRYFYPGLQNTIPPGDLSPLRLPYISNKLEKKLERVFSETDFIDSARNFGKEGGSKWEFFCIVCITIDIQKIIV